MKGKTHKFKNITTPDKINITAVVKTIHNLYRIERFRSLTTGEEQSLTDK